MALLPIVFVFHDFEEIIFMKYWYNKKGEYLRRRVPYFYPIIEKIMRKRATESFAFSVFFMFMLISVCTFYSIISGKYIIWWAAFLIFSIHLIMHITQSIVIRGYVPAVVTSVLCLPYAFWGYTLMKDKFDLQQTVIVTAICLPITIIYLIFAHKAGCMLNKKME